MEQENLKVLQTMLWGKILSKLCSLYVFSGGDTRTGQTGQTVDSRAALQTSNQQSLLLQWSHPPGLEIFLRFKN